MCVRKENIKFYGNSLSKQMYHSTWIDTTNASYEGVDSFINEIIYEMKLFMGMQLCMEDLTYTFFYKEPLWWD